MLGDMVVHSPSERHPQPKGSGKGDAGNLGLPAPLVGWRRGCYSVKRFTSSGSLLSMSTSILYGVPAASASAKASLKAW